MFLILFFLFWPQKLSDSALKDEFIVWNVGQGQWTTWIHNLTCHHFDMGGERNPTKIVLKKCSGLKNEIYISHWDTDHFSFLPSYTRALSESCIHPPFFGSIPQRLSKTLENLKTCVGLDSQIEQVFEGRPTKSQGTQQIKNPNSQVFLIKKAGILIPGDSTQAEEKLWIPRIQPLKGALKYDLKGWILGHHGSRSSTSLNSISHFSKIGWAVVSSRFKKYKHPHEKVVKLLNLKHIPLLKTEDWGHLHFLL